MKIVTNTLVTFILLQEVNLFKTALYTFVTVRGTAKCKNERCYHNGL